MSQLLLAQTNASDVLSKVVDKGYGWISTAVVAIIILVVVAAVLKAGASRFMKVPPDRALVRYGRGKTSIITGGSTLVLPLLYGTYEMDLSTFQVPIELNGVPNLDRIPVTIHATATCHISNKEELLQAAARTFGRKAEQTTIVSDVLKNALEGHLRVIIGTMTMDDILSKSDEFNKKVTSEAAVELQKLGCEIAILNIQRVTDEHGYIDALGKPKSASVKAEAAIKEAEATRDQSVQVSNAQREAATTTANNEQKIAEAQQTLAMKKAEIASQVNAANAKSAQAGPQAEAEASKAVLVAVVAGQEAKTIAEIKLQAAVAEKTEAELKATVIKQAEAQANAAKITADGVKARELIEAEAKGQARNITATAAATAMEKEAGASAAQIRTVGLAQAEMTAKTGQAEADAKKANLLAEADGETAKAGARKAHLLAEADGKKAEAQAVEALLLAQANGALKLNEAYAKLTPDAQRLFLAKQFMESGPALIAATGEAMAKALEPIAQALTSSLAAIDSVTVYDASGGKGGALDRAVSIGPDLFFRLVSNLKANGLYDGAVALLKQTTGLDLTELAPAIEVQATAVTGTQKGAGNGPVDKKAPSADAR